MNHQEPENAMLGRDSEDQAQHPLLTMKEGKKREREGGRLREHCNSGSNKALGGSHEQGIFYYYV